MLSAMLLTHAKEGKFLLLFMIFIEVFTCKSIDRNNGRNRKQKRK